MKRITIFVLLLILIITIAMMRNIYKVSREYIIINELGKEIPSQIIKKKDDIYSIIFQVKELEPYSIVISLKNKLIGLPNGGRDRYFNLTKNYIYDKWNNKNSFKIIYINGKEQFEPNPYNQYIDGKSIFKNIIFLDNEVSFDSYDRLKDYGNRVIIKQLSSH